MPAATAGLPRKLRDWSFSCFNSLETFRVTTHAVPLTRRDRYPPLSNAQRQEVIGEISNCHTLLDVGTCVDALDSNDASSGPPPLFGG